jgi:secreted PhoX family phosphatase
VDKPIKKTLDSFDDEDSNTSGNPSFMTVLDARLSRRSLLRGGVGGAAGALLGAWSLTACGGSDDPAPAPAPAAPQPLTTLGFAAVAKSLADAVAVPAGYAASTLYALGDPLTAATPAYKNDGTDIDFDNRAGDHHDGMEYFGLSASGAPDHASSTRGLLAINHEATSNKSSDVRSYYLHADGGTVNPRPQGEADKEIAVHGVSVVEVLKTGTRWAHVTASAFNRRVTPLTPVQISGPARGNGLLKTKYSTDGTTARGTLNNCGSGHTPWGTFLSGEENWNGYFTRSATDNAARADKSVVSLNRYGRAQGRPSRHGWETAGPEDKYARWVISKAGASTDGSDDYRNELNGFGYIVEMDPYDKTVAIKKRTALGRFAHESASFSLLTVDKPLAVYMGDDSQGEYIYKYVSKANWSSADAHPANRIATGDKYLDDGRLHVAKFNADGTGQWIELNVANAAIADYATYDFADQADVLVNARLAADAVGATRMDRPEWSAVHPTTGEVYYTLTNNANRRVEPTASQYALDAANPRAYPDTLLSGGAPSTSGGNVNGHIIRLREAGGEAAATAFTWDVYLFGAESTQTNTSINVSALTADQDFSSPDGLWFSRNTGICWIETDDGSYTDVSNCMMLAGIPGQVSDGAKTTLTFTKADSSTVTIDTYVGKKPAADTLKRFLVGPKDCEITGAAETPDGKTLFVNIQHPGESLEPADIADPSKYLSHWPGNAGYGAGGANARPRSATIAITKNDGGRIGT